MRRCAEHAYVIHIEGPLRVPINRHLRRTVRALLRYGVRRLMLDLSHVTRIDAAGVGELVRAYNMTVAVRGVLQVEQASPWVDQTLDCVGLFTILGRGDRRDS
jgi:anti-anti-sigma factor